MIIRHVCLYISDPDFSCGQPSKQLGQPEVVQEVLADLKSITFKIFDVDETVCA